MDELHFHKCVCTLRVISGRVLLTLCIYLQRPPTLIIFIAIVIAFLSDASFSVDNFPYIAPGYLALAVEAVTSSALDHTRGVLLPTLGPLATNLLTVIGAFVLSSAAYTFTQFLVSGLLMISVYITEHLM